MTTALSLIPKLLPLSDISLPLVQEWIGIVDPLA